MRGSDPSTAPARYRYQTPRHALDAKRALSDPTHLPERLLALTKSRLSLGRLFLTAFAEFSDLIQAADVSLMLEHDDPNVINS
jgi:hypothetical protein